VQKRAESKIGQRNRRKRGGEDGERADVGRAGQLKKSPNPAWSCGTQCG